MLPIVAAADGGQPRAGLALLLPLRGAGDIHVGAGDTRDSPQHISGVTEPTVPGW